MARTPHLIALALLMLLTAAPARAQTPCQPWFKHQNIGDFYPSGFAMVDLDPTGWPVLVGNAYYDGLEIWRFGPNGSVTPLGTVSEEIAYGLLAADFDNDGDTDLVAGHINTGTVHIFENTQGTLIEGPGTPAPGVLECAYDFDRDGLPDLIFTSPSDILIYINNDDGTFSEWISTPFEHVWDVFPATIDHDELPDVYVRSGAGITPIRQRADGTLETLAPFEISGEDVSFGDINGDGLTDLLYDEHSVAFADGEGGFIPGPDLDPRISSLSKLTDIDLDGDLDLLVNADAPDGTYGTAYTMLNDGLGNFTFLEHNNRVSHHRQPEYTLVEDVNRDGHLDLVVQRGRLIDLRFGFGDGSFDSVPYQPFFEGYLRRATFGDIDADGDLDIVATGDDPGPAIKVLTNDGNGNFTIVAAMAAPSTVNERVSLADFDADGDLDILAWTYREGIWIYENTPDGFYSQVHILPHRDGGPTAVAFVTHINNNGFLDIVAGDTEDGSQGYTIYFNRGNWEFVRRFTTEPVADHILALADFDNDGKADILCADSDNQEDELHICYRRTWKFGDPVPTRVFGDTSPLAMPGDFNGDGWMDFVLYGWITREVEVMINQRDGSFLHTATLERLFSTRDPGVLDLNGDGFDELVCASQSSSGKSALFTFNTAGEVIKEQRFGNAIGPMLGTPVGDLNGDGATDILLVSNFGGGYSGGVSVFLNPCPGTPCFPDLNNDGDTDTHDFIIYLARWAGQNGDDCSGYDCTADLDKNGTVDTRDLVTYLHAWSTSC